MLNSKANLGRLFGFLEKVGMSFHDRSILITKSEKT
jgi:hypothetical protein